MSSFELVPASASNGAAAEESTAKSTELTIPQSVRTAIVQKQTALRQHGLSRFIAKGPGLLATLEMAGLKGLSSAHRTAPAPGAPHNAATQPTIADKPHTATAAEAPAAPTTPPSSALVVGIQGAVQKTPPRTGESETARIEKILLEDPYWCDKCDGTPAASERMCPVTNKPHRRFLVVIADAFLRLIGEARVTTALADPTVPTTSNIVARRGIPINPQLLLLAYHSASMTADDVAAGVINPTQYDLAVQLVHSIDLMKDCFIDIASASNNAPLMAADGTPALRVTPLQRQHLGKIVQGFATTWRQYLNLAAAAAQQLDPRSPTAARQPADAVVATTGQLTLAQGTFPANARSSDGDATPPPTWNVRSPLTPMTPFTPLKYPGQPPTSFHRVTEKAQHHLIRVAIDAFVSLSEVKAKYFQQVGNGLAITAAPSQGSAAMVTTTEQSTDPKVIQDGLQQLEDQLRAIEQRILRIGGTEALEHAQQRVAKKLSKKPARQRAAGGRQSSPDDDEGQPTGGKRPPPLSRVVELDSDVSLSDDEPESAKPIAAESSTVEKQATSDILESALEELSSFVPAGQLAKSNGRRNAPGAITSASETEVSLSENEAPPENLVKPAVPAPPPRRARTTPFGPPLPPKWTVGKDGVSRPPPAPSVEKEAAEKKIALEFKTSQSYKARVALRQAAAKVPSEAEQAKKGISLQVEEAMWAAFEKELASEPPVLARVPAVLRMVADGLIEVLPKRLRTQVGEEIRDTLDWDMVKYNSIYDVRAIAAVLRYVTDKVAEYGAPARETEVRMRLNALVQRLDLISRLADTSDKKTRMISALLDSFKFMTASVRQLHQDITTYGLSVIAPELALGYVESAKQYAADWMKPPDQWASSKAWAAKALSSAVANDVVVARPDAPELTDTEVKLVVGVGLINLISSAKKGNAHRWADFPGDLMHFEAPSIFTSANTLQVCALRLMINNTITMVLSGRVPKVPVVLNAAAQAALARVHAAQGRAAPAAAPAAPAAPSNALDAQAIKQFAGMLDNKLKAWFGVAPDPVTGEVGKVLPLPKLKDEVVAETNHFLVSRSLQHNTNGSDAPPATVFLNDSEKRMLHNILEKVSNTESIEYITFEGRLTKALITALKLSLSANSDTSSDDESVDSNDDSPQAQERRAKRVDPFEKLGIVEGDMGDLATDLDNIARLSVEVHLEAYRQHLLPPRPAAKP